MSEQEKYEPEARALRLSNGDHYELAEVHGDSFAVRSTVIGRVLLGEYSGDVGWGTLVQLNMAGRIIGKMTAACEAEFENISAASLSLAGGFVSGYIAVLARADGIEAEAFARHGIRGTVAAAKFMEIVDECDGDARIAAAIFDAKDGKAAKA